ncbi:uncharacterized protein J4E79_001128 [Alternaria viburni]|uniref:uncharacterized protein n=1 Tax=Alternaria viburni TaxID=566460 RepID=UPI0020C44168|nr:uncharacterized protein J4E79_001128 [Alternaria viburni]KAI4669085.1 hypothetical protein J4E79_001128 [Alternaria viburni]
MPPMSATPRSTRRSAAAAKKKVDTPKGTSSTKQANKVKIARNRKDDGKEEVLTPGKDPKDFIQVHKCEGLVGSYAMFGRRDDFRKFVLSSLVLNSYVNAFTDRGNIQVRQKNVLEYIRDQKVEMESDVSPIEVYPVQMDGRYAVQRTALACAQMYRQVEKAASGQRPFDQDQENRAVSAFKALTDRQLPVFDRSDVSVKSFGPHLKYGESDLEPYNRAFNVIMYLAWCLSPKVWKSRFGIESWDEEVHFATLHVPHWMREQEATKTAAQAPDQTASASEPSRPNPEVQPRWLRLTEAKSPKQQKLMEYLTDHGLDLDSIPELRITVRPTATVAEVRDIIRARFLMDQDQA